MENNTIKTSRPFIHNWWGSLLVGIFLVIAGIWVLLTPLASYVALAVLFSVSMLISGIMEIYFAITNRRGYKGWGWHLTAGILDLVIGAVLISFPVISLAILPLVVGFWLTFRGIMAIGTAIELRSMNVRNWGWLLFWGICTLVFSFFVITNPLFGTLSIVVMTSMAFLTAGIFRIYLAFRLRKLQRPDALVGGLRTAA